MTSRTSDHSTQPAVTRESIQAQLESITKTLFAIQLVATAGRTKYLTKRRKPHLSKYNSLVECLETLNNQVTEAIRNNKCTIETLPKALETHFSDAQSTLNRLLKEYGGQEKFDRKVKKPEGSLFAKALKEAIESVNETMAKNQAANQDAEAYLRLATNSTDPQPSDEPAQPQVTKARSSYVTMMGITGLSTVREEEPPIPTLGSQKIQPKTKEAAEDPFNAAVDKMLGPEDPTKAVQDEPSVVRQSSRHFFPRPEQTPKTSTGIDKAPVIRGFNLLGRNNS